MFSLLLTVLAFPGSINLLAACTTLLCLLLWSTFQIYFHLPELISPSSRRHFLKCSIFSCSPKLASLCSWRNRWHLCLPEHLEMLHEHVISRRVNHHDVKVLFFLSHSLLTVLTQQNKSRLTWILTRCQCLSFLCPLLITPTGYSLLLVSTLTIRTLCWPFCFQRW